MSIKHQFGKTETRVPGGSLSGKEKRVLEDTGKSDVARSIAHTTTCMSGATVEGCYDDVELRLRRENSEIVGRL